MWRIVWVLVIGLSAAARAQQGFTLQQVLSAPYATNLTAAPTGTLFAWVEHTEGRNNLWVGGPEVAPRQLTHNTEDDAQDITQLAWAPDASAIAYTYGAETAASGKPANPAHLQRPTPLIVMVQPIEADAAPTIIGEGRSPLFEPLSHRLLFLRGGQIWSARLDLKCPPATACSLDVPEKSVSQLVFDRGSASQLTLSPDGRTLAFISRRHETSEPSHSYLALFALPTRTLAFPAPSTGNDSAPVFSPDSRELAWLRAPFTEAPEFALNRVSANPWSIQMLHLATGDHEEFYRLAENRRGSVLPHLATGEPRLFWTSPAPHYSPELIYFSEVTGWVNLWELQFGGASSGPREHVVASGAFEVEDVSLSSDGKTLTWSSNNKVADPLDADRGHIWQADVSRFDPIPVMLTKGEGIETHPVRSGDGSVLAALVSDTRTPMMPALIEPDGSMRALHPRPLSSGYPSATLVSPLQVFFDSADGLHLHGQLFLPAKKTGPPASRKGDNTESSGESQKHPAIVFFHGGPRRQMLLGYPAMDYYSNAYAFNQYLVSRGFIVLSVNYRCGIGYGLEFRQCAHGGADGASEYADVLAAQKYLASRPDVDAKRIGLWGGSYGGYLTALGLARNSDLFAAGVDFHGVHDWRLEDNASDWLRGSNAEKDAIAAKALASSPMADIDKWRSPVLLIHGDDDPEVAYAQTPVLADALRRRSVPVEELILPDEVHGFLLHRDWIAAYQAAAFFLERTFVSDSAK